MWMKIKQIIRQCYIDMLATILVIFLVILRDTTGIDIKVVSGVRVIRLEGKTQLVEEVTLCY